MATRLYKLTPVEELLVDTIGETESYRKQLRKHFSVYPLAEVNEMAVERCVKSYLRKIDWFAICRHYGINPGEFDTLSDRSKRSDKSIYEGAMRILRCGLAIQLSYLIQSPEALKEKIGVLKAELRLAFPPQNDSLEKSYMLLYRFYAAVDAYESVTGERLPEHEKDWSEIEPEDDVYDRMFI